MSAGGSIDRAEPNMTPLLDVVLQLIMFFMLVTNFAMEQVDEAIKLPTAVSAKPLDSKANDYALLNVRVNQTTDKPIITVGSEVYEGAIQLKTFLRNQYELDKARTKPDLWEAGQGRSIIIIRGDKGCRYKHINAVTMVCQQAGYRNVQLRVIQKDGIGTAE